MILQALDRYYTRLAARGDAEPQGWARVPIGWAITLSPQGEPVAVMQLLDTTGRKHRSQLHPVPTPVIRKSNILPNKFWDKTEYALGVTQAPDAKTPARFASFKAANMSLTDGNDDAGVLAFRRFLEQWTPHRFDMPPFRADMLDANVVFRLDGELLFIHQRPAVLELLSRDVPAAEQAADICLVTGKPAVPLRLHPVIKGVYGAQSSGASLVSFNLDAFRSYGKDQGANAPTAESAAERYGASLNAMLASGERNRLRRGIGDATVVFWADAEDEACAHAAESFFSRAFSPAEDANEDDGDAGQAAQLRDSLQAVAEGRPETVDPKLRPGVRFHVLGLSPNAARLSVRFWLADEFDVFAAAILRHMQDIAIEPPPRDWSSRKGPPALWRLLLKTTALQEKFDNVPPLLAGELARAVLGGLPYPRLWLTACITRLRAGDSPASGWHAAAIKACINRNTQEEDLPVALDPDNTSDAYQLGRLFAIIEAAQYAALGRINATVADRFYGAASSTPARVFASLLRNARNHVSDVKRRGGGGWIERSLDEIIGRLPPALPRTLKLEDQGRFAVGYYHQRATRPPKPNPGADQDTQASAEPSAETPAET